MKSIKTLATHLTMGLLIAGALIVTGDAAHAAPYNFNGGQINADNSASGVVTAKYKPKTAGQKVKFQVLYGTGKTYTYNFDLNNVGNTETYPLQCGNGNYTMTVYEQIEGTRYTTAGKTTKNITYSNANAPFLASTQYVKFDSASAVAKKAKEIVTKAKAKTDIAKLNAIYTFIVNNFKYDTAKAQNTKALVGYVPNLNTILNTKKGICFDYASMLAAMLRSQGIPAKLVFGDVPVGKGKAPVYHAWNEVYLNGKGWVSLGKIQLNAKTFTRLDPTFASSSKSSKNIVSFIGNGSNYTKKYYF